MMGQYDPLLVMLSLMVAVTASWSALDLSQRIHSTDPRAARIWLFSGALVLGTGIWSMHFVGMLAYALPMQTGFDLLITVQSWGVSVLVSVLSLICARGMRRSLPLLAAGALAVGGGIVVIFHLALSAMRIEPGVVYDEHRLFIALLGAAAVAGATGAALRHMRALEGRTLFLVKAVTSVVVGVGLCAVHYLCMSATVFAPEAASLARHDIDPTWLGLTIAVGAIGFTWIGSVAALFDARMEHRTRQLAMRLKAANSELMHAALHDPLTGLPNRVNFDAALSEAAARVRAQGGRLAVLFVDLDGFKPVNDVLGHHVGDEVLKCVARRLRAGLRDGDAVARIGGDEFVMMSGGAIDQEGAGRLAQRLVDAASQPMQIGTHEIQVSASVGVALFPDDGDENRVLVCADTAMYAAKHAGRNTWRVYATEMDGGGPDILGMQRAIRRALDNDEFVLHYQPKVAALDGSLRGVEALIRWQDPERGVVSPGEFIPVAERFGLINAIGFWTLREACGQIRSWQHAGWRIPVAVNLSPQQFRQPDLVERVRACIDEFDIDPGLLALEITESVVMESSSSVRRVLEELKAMGVTLSIDDFGTGYSCLAYLCRLPARQLKIDRTFVIDMDHVAEARHVVEAVIRLAHSLRMEVVAEGVERPEQVVTLRALGCDLIQGYYFSRPVPAAGIEALMQGDQLTEQSARVHALAERLRADSGYGCPPALELVAG